MANLSYPGVYVEEVSSGVRPIAAASTSTPAFVGLAEMGPDNETKRITSWAEFQKFYGTFTNYGYLAQSVFQFFNNGGQQCYIVRVTLSNAAKADVTVQNRASVPVAGFKFSAKNKGAWGNYLLLQIENASIDPGNCFKVSIRKQTLIDVVPENISDIAPLEVHDNLSMDPDASNYVVTVLSANSSLIDAQVLGTNTSLQRGIHRGGFNPTLPLGDNKSFQINVEYDGFQVIELPASVKDSTTIADIATAITTAVQALTKKKTTTPSVAFTQFECTVETSGSNKRLILQSGTNKPAGTQSVISSVRIQNASTTNGAGMLRLGESNGGRSEDARAVRRPALASVIQIGDAAVAAPVTAVTLGVDGTAALTEPAYQTAFSLLNNKTDFSLLAVPDFGTEVMFDLGVAYCQNRALQDVFYIGHMYDHYVTPADAENFRKALTKPSSYGAVYFPWVKTLDPTGKSKEPITLPPVGYVAGLYARIDSSRGVWKAPAGTEATLSGASGLTINLTDIEQGNLNRINVNCIRRFSSAGIVSWGARTIASDPEYQYVPVRRLAIMLRVSIYNGIQWAVFEPNDEELWASLRLNINSFMMTLYRQGAFQGSMPSQAFFVKCDSETTTQDDINLGIVNVLIGFAPLKPAEFIVVKISQKAGQAS